MAQSFKLKGSLFTLSVLQILTHDLDAFERDLKAKIRLAPKFFNFTPMVLDLQLLQEQEKFDFAGIKSLLERNNVIPVGAKSAAEAAIPIIRGLGLALMSDPASKEDKLPQGGNSTFAEGTKIISEPIRGGQRVYAEGGDLIVVGAVSPGAELLADGNIHVYGTLRGRALAGINDNKHARIFCQNLAAELVSIAGQYQLFENLESITQGLTEIYLKEEKLIIARI